MSRRDLKDWLLSVPTFYKILLANAAVVITGAVVGTLFTASITVERGLAWELIAGFSLVGVTLSLIVNSLLLGAALAPFRSLREVLDQVRSGNLSARVKGGVLRDPDIDRMAETVNHTLDAVEAYSQRVKALSRQVLNAQESERLRVARELHDETAQNLTYMMLRVKIAERGELPRQVLETLEELHQLMLKSLDGIKRLALELRPAALDELGLAAALGSHINGYRSMVGIDVSFEATGLDSQLDSRLPREVEVVVYRVVQEALTNIAKYAAASRVDVRLERGPKGLDLFIRDNGRGFDVAQALGSRGRGLGLFGMQERIGLVDGTIEWESAPGAGTEVRAFIPLEPPAPVQDA